MYSLFDYSSLVTVVLDLQFSYTHISSIVPQSGIGEDLTFTSRVESELTSIFLTQIKS